jgi:signal transduction histidine kinase
MDDKGRHIGDLVMVTDGSEREHAQEEADRLKGEFFGLVSHELRTPLTSIKGYLELLLEGRAGGSTDDGGRFLEVIKRNTARLERLVEDLLFVARLDAGRLVLKTTVFKLDELAAERVEGPRAAAEQVHVFEPFFRASGATEREIQGAGLGLTIAKAIAEAHGGRVDVEGGEGSGATFRVALPLQNFPRER